MSQLRISFADTVGVVKPMHAGNNGPLFRTDDQSNSNFDVFQALRIPYVRNHDAAHCAYYGGNHVVDILAVFPDFDADPEDPASYDFALTDDYVANTYAAGSKVFYRLGSRIEHARIKYGTLVPGDYGKWAVICEHIIRHYTEGWNQGFTYDMEYWEVWNEPDLYYFVSDLTRRPCWSGTLEQFCDFFETAVCHLKRQFPRLKIGGPAVSGWNDWVVDFIREIGRRRVPMDFFSWHGYSNTTDYIRKATADFRDLLNECGFSHVESIYDEWNYVHNWSEEFPETIRRITGIRGAAFSAAMMLAGQDLPVDMMMYYDFRPCVMNGLFDLYTPGKTLPGYYPFLYFSALYQLGQQVSLQLPEEEKDLYAVAAKNGTEGAVMAAYFTDQPETAEAKTVTLSLDQAPKGLSARYSDEGHTDELMPFSFSGNTVTFTLKPNAFALIRVEL